MNGTGWYERLHVVGLFNAPEQLTGNPADIQTHSSIQFS